MRYFILLAMIGTLTLLTRTGAKPLTRVHLPVAGPSQDATRRAPSKEATRTPWQYSAMNPVATATTTPPSSEPPPMTKPEVEEQARIGAMFEKVTPALSQCLGASVHARGKLEFRYHLTLAGDGWTMAQSDDALELIDSTLAESDDDAAVDCMRSAARGLTLPMADSIHEGAESYDIYWSWQLGSRS
jgi:hypothetical protein